MLRTLLESNAAPTRRRGGIMVSLLLHTAVLALAVAATASANLRPPATRDPRPTPPFYIINPRPPVPHGPRESISDGRPVCCVSIPERLDIPQVAVRDPGPIDVHPPVMAPDWHVSSCLVCAPGVGGGGAGATGSRGDVYTGETVEWAAHPMPDNPAPVYPPALRAAQIEGVVDAQFIIDTLGRAETASIIIRQATQSLFGDAVRQALLRSRYEPAMVGNRRVRQLVEQRFTFSLIR
jgi:TonB family protein